LSVHEKIRKHLDGLGISYREIHHAPTPTSEESARARGEPLAVGGKALVLRLGNGIYTLFVFSAARRLDSGSVRKRFGRGIRFATPEELLELTGLVPGSVPPFGSPILPMPLYADPSTLANDRIAFNAGSLTDSMVMASADWARAASPEVFPFTRE
jgi:Ala-tRNA(Pro) deacylase